VSFSEACTVFDDSLAKIFYDSDHSKVEEREIIIGRSLTETLLLGELQRPGAGSSTNHQRAQGN